ncbi:hypothetical protein [Streptomyces sp. NPDC054834]
MAAVVLGDLLGAAGVDDAVLRDDRDLLPGQTGRLVRGQEPDDGGDLVCLAGAGP